MELSKDQKNALDSLLQWYYNQKDQYITFGGYAGTGKTTLIALFRKELGKMNKNLRIAFCSYTGKAARVLTSTLKELKCVKETDSISTIHGLIYTPIEDENFQIIGWKKKNRLNVDLIVVDEASMVDDQIWSDLCSYNIRIIACGDHGQLPPVGEKLGLMENPKIRLEEIHRQARDNPIIKLSFLAREEGKIIPGEYGRNVVKISKDSETYGQDIEEILDKYDEDTLLLCGYNHTRVKLNAYIRNKLEFESLEPIRGDRVICLRNNRSANIYNGMLGTIQSIKPKGQNLYIAEILMDDEENLYTGSILQKQFGMTEPINFTDQRRLSLESDLFDFGYALTVHKAQGSQAERVIMFEERFSKMDDDTWRRWLYTGITRAREELFLIGD